ncbi:MAG TPA: MFS transporter [Marmoricola sp.]|nr:MFS transporter [Marmoricola sp.]HNO39669.1 MFS transporter [Marmoricola sp.]
MSELRDNPEPLSNSHRWAILAASTWAQASSSVAINGPAFLIPAMKQDLGLSLTTAATLAALSIAGVLAMLVIWGWLADHWGERRVLLLGILGTLVAALVGTQARDPYLLGGSFFAMGAFGASTSAASGRVVIGWFPPHRRGMAMGIRQMAQPLGVAIGALTMGSIAHRWGLSVAIWVPVIASALGLLAVLVVVIDPPRLHRSQVVSANPYRESSFLTRIHLVSALLVIPQFVVWTFALTWLVDHRDWPIDLAGTVVAGMHVLGALGRIGVGHLSDVVGSRVRPLAWVALAAAITMGLLAALEQTPLAVLLMVVASGVTVADNGLAFTSVAERAGDYWAGRALGIQNTGQYAVATASAPLAGVLITHLGYSVTFGLIALAPLLALPLIPRRDEDREPSSTGRG